MGLMTLQLLDSGGSKMAELARPESFFARLKGLLGTNSLPSGQGILLDGRQVHTLGMRYSIDAVYLSKDDTVLRVVQLRPWRFGPFVRRARSIVELSSGEADRLGLAEGKRLRILRSGEGESS